MKKKYKKFKILLIGGSGNLGSSIIKANKIYKLDAPTKKKLNLNNRFLINKFLKKNYDIVINCAGMARVSECENKPHKAIDTNVVGTLNLVQSILNYENKFNKKIKLLHISSDAVYPSIKGNYKENSALYPYNVYGWTKYLSELIVKKLDNFVIIRTRFFNKKKFKYNNAAIDIFSSMIEVNKLSKVILNLIKKGFNGILNVGSKKKSDYSVYKKFVNNLRKSKREDLLKKLDYVIGKDSSMNLSKYKKIFYNEKK